MDYQMFHIITWWLPLDDVCFEFKQFWLTFWHTHYVSFTDCLCHRIMLLFVLCFIYIPVPKSNHRFAKILFVLFSWCIPKSKPCTHPRRLRALNSIMIATSKSLDRLLSRHIQAHQAVLPHFTWSFQACHRQKQCTAIYNAFKGIPNSTLRSSYWSLAYFIYSLTNRTPKLLFEYKMGGVASCS
jgi:hypothetical protein